jgi:DNA uptake protein ComE-like DNA-binding protein
MRPIRWIVLYITIIFAAVSASGWQAAATGNKNGASSPSNKMSGPAKTSGSAKSSGSAKMTSSAEATPAGAVDINHASKEDLQKLPGIGDAYANAIIKNRPYKNKTQLRSRNVIPDATYNKIKDKIIAKQ